MLSRVVVLPVPVEEVLSQLSDVSNVDLTPPDTLASSTLVSSTSPTPIPSGASISMRPTKVCDLSPNEAPASNEALNPESREFA